MTSESPDPVCYAFFRVKKKILISTLALLALIEIAFRIANPPTFNVPYIITAEPKEWDIDDPDLGYRLIPNLRVSLVANKKNSGQIVFKSSFSTDEFGRRVTPGVACRPDRSAALFFGDSYTFGWGVSDDETLSYFTRKFSNCSRVLNYGLAAYGPQQTWMKLSKMDARAEVPELPARRVLVYTFLDFHPERAAGVFGFFQTRKALSFPALKLNAQGELIYEGSFKSARPVSSYFYKMILSSYFYAWAIDRLHSVIGSPAPIDLPALRLTSKILAESAKLFKEKFKSDEFYVLVYPDRFQHREKIKVFLSYLKEDGVKSLDYSGLLDNVPFKKLIPIDWHPTPESYQYVAKQLVKDLKL